MISNPATIVEGRDLVARLTSLGFGEMLSAMRDVRFFPKTGRAAGRFAVDRYARQKGITRRRATKLLVQLRAAVEQLTT